MTVESDPRRDPWRESIAKAADEARRMQPLATAVFVFAVVLYVVNVLWPLTQEGTWREMGLRLVAALPAAILISSLWDVHVYLRKLVNGELWGPATTRLLGQVGDALQYVAAAVIVIVPSLLKWIGGRPGGLDFRLEPEYLAFAALGLLLSMIARVVGNVVEAAAALKAENDEIV
jgi:hypothetical protein